VTLQIETCIFISTDLPDQTSLSDDAIIQDLSAISEQNTHHTG